MCPKCNKLHTGACEVARNPADVLASIEQGVVSMRDGLKKVDERFVAFEDRVKALESGAKRRKLGVSLPGVEDEKEKFSFQRAILAISTKDFSIAPFEMDVMRECNKKRDLSTDVDSAGGYLVPNEFMTELIELLRAKLVVGRLGVTRFSGLTGGSIMVPKQTGAATGYWVAENADVTESQQTVGQLEMRPREAAGMTVVSDRLLRLSNPGAEAMIRSDLAAVIDRLVDLAVLQGTGGTQPLGIVNTSGINTTSMATTPTVDLLYAMMYEVEADNADAGNLGWAFHPRTWNTLRQLKDANGNYILMGPNGPGVALQNSDRGPAQGTLLGHPFATTTQIPTNLGATTNRSRIYFGNWSDVVVGEWEGLMLRASQETNDAFQKRQTWVQIVTEMDCLLKHGESFCVDSTVAA